MAVQVLIEPESFISTFTVVSAPPETRTPTHHTLLPVFKPTLMVFAPGWLVGADVGADVGAMEGTDVGVEGDPVEEEEGT